MEEEDLREKLKLEWNLRQRVCFQAGIFPAELLFNKSSIEQASSVNMSPSIQLNSRLYFWESFWEWPNQQTIIQRQNIVEKHSAIRYSDDTFFQPSLLNSSTL